jgi:hypothetical protein
MTARRRSKPARPDPKAAVRRAERALRKAARTEARRHFIGGTAAQSSFQTKREATM